jgi:hypothetical protein
LLAIGELADSKLAVKASLCRSTLREGELNDVEWHDRLKVQRRENLQNRATLDVMTRVATPLIVATLALPLGSLVANDQQRTFEWGEVLEEKNSGTFPSALPDGTAVIFADGQMRGLAFLRNQQVSPESLDFDWFLRRDGLIDFNPGDKAVESGTSKGAKSIAFGPFEAKWSAGTTGLGYLYLSGIRDVYLGVVFGATLETISTRLRTASLYRRGKYYRFAIPSAALPPSPAPAQISSGGGSTNLATNTYRPDGLILQRARINDPDGFVFVRAGTTTNSPVIGEIRQGEVFYTCEDPYSNWWLIMKARSVRNGFVHKSRIEILPGNPLSQTSSR